MGLGGSTSGQDIVPVGNFSMTIQPKPPTPEIPQMYGSAKPLIDYEAPVASVENFLEPRRMQSKPSIEMQPCGGMSDFGGQVDEQVNFMSDHRGHLNPSAAQVR